jgi:Mg/Co/Ni transporter MgtE
MESDDAADLVNDLPEERREDVVALLPHAQRRRVRALLGYDPSTAGGLMSPDFICVYSQATAEEVFERIRRSTYSPDSITWIYVMNQHRRLKGAVQVVDLVRAEPGAPVGDIARLPQHVRPNADLEEVARLMTDYDLSVVPVVDDEDRVMGVITVDDVLELVLPQGWRRHFHLFGDE